MKEKTRLMKHPELVDAGDAYTFTAIERESKLVLAWHLGTRTPEDTAYFADKLAIATAGEFQISTDGFLPLQNGDSERSAASPLRADCEDVRHERRPEGRTVFARRSDGHGEDAPQREPRPRPHFDLTR